MGDIATYTDQSGRLFRVPTGDFRRDVMGENAVSLTRFQAGVARAMPDLGERMLRFTLATEGVKRDGHSLALSPDAWIMDEVQRFGLPMLWGHDMGSKPSEQRDGRPPMLPIGKWENIEFVRDGNQWRMIGDARFGTDDFAEKVYNAYLPRSQGGDETCNSCSLDWRPLDAVPIPTGFHFTRNDPLEGSLIPVGADPSARSILIQRGLVGDVDEYARWSGLADEQPYVLQTERGYILDGRDPIERSAEPVTEPEKKIEPQPDAGPKVRTIDAGDPQAFTLSPKDGKVGFVLVSRGAKATAEELAKMAEGCVRSLETRAMPELAEGWQSIPVAAGGEYVLTYRGEGDAPSGQHEKIQRGLEESVEAGDVAVMSGDWQLQAVGRSARSDALDLAFVQFRGNLAGIAQNIDEIRWMVDEAFYEDEADDAAPSEMRVKNRLRTLNLLESLLENAQEVASDIRDLIVPEPVAVEPIVPVIGVPQAASATEGITRAGKKYSKARLKKLKAAHAELSDMLSEAAAEHDATETKPPDTVAQGAETSEWARAIESVTELTRSLSAARQPEPEPQPAATPEPTPSPLAELTRSMNETSAKFRAETTEPAHEGESHEPVARSSFGDLARDMNELTHSLRSAAT